jgi:SPP1 family predicted phage head-tail adaptor
MKAGKLRKRLEVQYNAADPDNPTDRRANGELIERWLTGFSAWGSVEPLSGREFWAAAQVQADVTHKITIRYRTGVALTADMRIKLGTRVFHLSAPPRDIEEGHRAWEILATEVVRNPV